MLGRSEQWWWANQSFWVAKALSVGSDITDLKAIELKNGEWKELQHH